MSTDPQVRAAGGVVRNHDGHVLVVHRPEHGDWSLPKGKLEDAEPWHAAAVREVHEETGVVARLGAELSPTRYRDRRGRDKVVRWWTMTTVAVRARPPDDEVDHVRWVPASEVGALLTYDSDRALVEDVVAHEHRRTVLVVRHAHAGARSSWSGDDRERPLSDRGRRQADELVRRLGAWHLTGVVTSPLVRCVQTVAPLAARLGVELQADDRLAEGATREDTWALLGTVPSGTVLCSHGDVVESLVRDLVDAGLVDGDPTWRKGSTWVLTLDGSRRATAASHVEAPA